MGAQRPVRRLGHENGGPDCLLGAPDPAYSHRRNGLRARRRSRLAANQRQRERRHADPGRFDWTTDFAWTEQGVPDTVDPDGYGTSDVTDWTYTDATRGFLLPAKRTDPLVGDTLFTWDGFNRKATETDPNGLKTEWTYDSMDRVTQVKLHGDPATTADDLVTLYRYTALGELGCIKYPRGNGVQFIYEAASGRLAETIRGTAVTSPTGSNCLNSALPRERRLVTYTLASGNPPYVVNEKLQRFVSGAWVTDGESEQRYETSCQLSKSIEGANHPEASTTSFGYDCNGNLTTVTRALGTGIETTTTYGYDPLDRLASVSQTWGGAGGGSQVTAYGYDAQDHLTSVTDAEGNVTTSIYSDRDLLTRQESPVTGVTRFRYNEHGELVEEHQDARSVSIFRAVDAADRVTLVDYPGTELDTSFAWERGRWPGEGVQVDVGHLFAISSGGQTIDYQYDSNWRLVGDGVLTYVLDANGNRSETTYPQGLTVRTTYDFADRPAKLEWKEGAASYAFLVGGATTSAAYAAFGPLTSLPLGNTLTETRSFDFRYAPDTIAVSGSLLSWGFTVDALGDIVAIDDTLPSDQNRSFGYQPHQRYVTSASGPWSGPLTWTYDRMGNRLTEIRGGVGGYSDTYDYLSNGGGNRPTLAEVNRDGSLLRDYLFDAGGFLDNVAIGANTIDFTFDAAGRLAQTARPAALETLEYSYDGRGYLNEAKTPSVDLEPPCPTSARKIFCDGYESSNLACWDAVVGGAPGGSCPWKGVFDAIDPVYSSEGVLLGLDRMFAGTLDRRAVFYFGSRPVALWKNVGSAPLPYLTTDHLGTPILAMNGSGLVTWSGGFEPFGTDWQAGGTNGALSKGIFLRLPGQFDDVLFEDSTLGVELYSNVHRWYEPQVGMYMSGDSEMNRFTPGLDFQYVGNRPLSLTDPLGLAPCSPEQAEQCKGRCAALRERYTGCSSISVRVPCVGTLEFAWCSCEPSPCAPCPPGGPFPNVRIDKVPPSRPHFPCKGDHWHYRKYSQDPVTCKCFPSPWLLGGCFN
jgi:RHS repeat-associated protein